MLRYAITSRGLYPGDERQQQAALLRQAHRWSAESIDFIQLREKDLPDADIAALAREILSTIAARPVQRSFSSTPAPTLPSPPMPTASTSPPALTNSPRNRSATSTPQPTAPHPSFPSPATHSKKSIAPALTRLTRSSSHPSSKRSSPARSSRPARDWITFAPPASLPHPSRSMHWAESPSKTPAPA